MRYFLHNRAKSLVLTIGLVMLVTFAQAQRTASVSGNWSSTATWGGSSVPTSADAVTINSGITVTVDANAQCASLTFAAVNANSVLTISNTNTLSITGLLFMPRPATGFTCTVNVNAGSLNCGSLTMAARSTPRNDIINISTGSLTVNGTYTANSSSTVQGCQFIFSGSGMLTFGGTISLGETTGPTITSFAGSTVKYSGTSQTGIVATYSNLTLAGSGTKTFAAAPTVNEVLSMEGTATISRAPTYGTSATLQYNTLNSRTEGAEWPATFIGTGGVVIKNTGTITLASAMVFGNSTNVPLNINSGATLATANNGLTFHGDFINNGTLTAGSSPIVITGTTSSQSIGSITTTGLISMTKTGGTATFTGNINGAGLTLNGSGGTLNLGSGLTHTFTGTWTRTAGTLNGGSSLLNLSASIPTSGSGGTFTAGTGTVEYPRAGAQTIAPVTYNNLTLSGSSFKIFALLTTTTVNGILSMEGSATAQVFGTLTYGSSATLQYMGSGAQTTGAEFPASFSALQLNEIKIENASGVTLNAAKDIGARSLTIGSLVNNSIFRDGGFSLTSTGALNLNSGSYFVTSAGFPAFSGTTIATGTTVNYARTNTQTIKGITYSNLTISGSGTNSKTADADITVNGILNVESANASSTGGCLDMSTYTLNMGADATTTGTGDVTGIVKRTQTFENNIPYSFGNQYTNITFLGISGGTKPAWLSCKITIGAAPVWKTGAVQRVYSFAKDASATDRLITNLHFLTSELNSNTASSLVFWDEHDPATLPDAPEEHGKSNSDLTNNWIGVSGFSVTYLAPNSVLGSKEFSLADGTGNNVNQWLGNNASWTDVANWSLGHTPLTTEDVLIPSDKTNYPTMVAGLEIKSLSIQSGATFTTGSNTLTINGYTGAFSNNGTFTGTGGTVIFSHGITTHIVSINGTGANNFNNLTVNSNTYLQPQDNFILKIAGTVTNNHIIDLKATNNIVEYNGADQTITNLQGPSSDVGYSNLVISGTNATLPATLNVMRDFTVSSGSTTAAASSTIVILGNCTLSGGTFSASDASISIGGNWTNNGGTFTAGTSTVTFNSTTAGQAINGTAASQSFNSIVVNKSGQTLTVGGSTATLNLSSLTITAGTLAAGTASAINLTGNWSNSGTYTGGSGTVLFTGSSAQTITGTTTFNNLTINNAAGVTGASNLTVSNSLTLTSSNPAGGTTGTLDMGANILSITNSSGTVSGTGDVTGTFRRSHTFTPNTSYSFGNQYTTLTFLGIGTQPSEVSCTISIGTEPSWKTGAVKRYYSFAQTGSGTDQVLIRLNYLDSEIQANTEPNLVLWDRHASATIHEHGHTNSDASNNWVELEGLTIDYVAPASTKYWMLSDFSSAKNTWNGVGTNWSNSGSWSKGNIPVSTDDVLIPTGLVNYPTLSADAAAATIEIESGASLSASNLNLRLYGKGLTWSNQGTFNPGTGTVYFEHGVITEAVLASGTTQFYNIHFGANTYVIPLSGTIIRISGLADGDVTSMIDLAAYGSTVEYNGTDPQYIANPSTAGFSETGYYNLIISGAGTKTLVSDQLDIAGNFTNNGTLNLSTASVNFIGTMAQTISGTNTFLNLNINNPAGVTAANNLTVNGILNLAASNPSSSKGALELVSNWGTYPAAYDLTSAILTMGSSATTTGPGDVTGKIYRASPASNTAYTYGNQFTTIAFMNPSTPPDNVTVVVKIGDTYSSKSDAVQRMYEITPNALAAGGSVTANFHYLDSELQSNTETKLTTWDFDIGSSSLTDEHGRADYNFTNNFIGLSNVPMDYFIYNASGHNWRTIFTLGDFADNHLTWNGSMSTDWSTTSNWTPSGTPSYTTYIIIPDASTTPNDPVLPSGTSVVNTLTIENGGILAMGSNTLEIQNALSGGWEDQNPAGNDPGTSTVTFANPGASVSGNARFYNVGIADGADLTNQSGSTLKIANIISRTGTGKWYTGVYSSEVEYNGAGQTILAPDDAYYNLVLSGSGTKTLPASAISVRGDFTNNGTTVSATGNTLTLDGTTAQTMGGSSASTFNNLTVNNSSGITLSANATVSGTFTLTSGIVTTGLNTLTSSGTISGGSSTSYINGKLAQVYSGTGSKVFPIGKGGNYRPLTLNYTALTGTSTVTAEQFESIIPGTLPANVNIAGRYWSITESGSAARTYTLSLDGTDFTNTSHSDFIIKGNGATNTAYSATYAAPIFSYAGFNDFSNFSVGENSNALWLGVNSSWSDPANWDTGSSPSNTDNASIPSTGTMPVISGSVEINNIDIASGGSLNVSGDLTLTGMLTINSDGSNSGSVIVTGTVSGDVTYNRYMNGGRWYIASSPVNIPGSIGSWLPGKDVPISGGVYGMTAYKETTNTWDSYFTTSTGDGFVPGKGYLIRKTSNGTIPFTGTINSGTISQAITRTVTGWNSVGNPYASPIGMNSTAASTNNFLTQNAVGQLDPNYGAVYYWDEAGGYAGGSYQIINNTNAGTYFQAGQGFLVKSISGGGTLQFTSDMCFVQNSQILRSAMVSTWNRLVMQASSGGKTRSTSVSFRSDMTTGLDVTFDAGIYKSDPNFELYTRLVDDNGIDFAIQCLPTDNWNSLSIPVGIDFPLGGEVIFSINSMDIPAGYYPLLTDKLLNNSTYLKTADDMYNVSLPSGTTGVGRFYLTFGDGSTTGIKEPVSGGFNLLKVYPNPASDLINIQLEGSTGALTLQIINIQGIVVRELKSELTDNNRHTFKVDVNYLPKGLYMVNVTFPDGSRKTERVVIGR